MNYYTDIQYTGNLIHLAVKIDTSRTKIFEMSYVCNKTRHITTLPGRKVKIYRTLSGW